ncbi:MAG: hypothetical protein Q8P18_23255 [Pseudomonadota bacterium]|nr:hypothetical protein [Pseudomonadota bacterium]
MAKDIKDTDTKGTPPKVLETGERGTMSVRDAGRKGGEEVQRQRDLRDRKEIRGQAYDKPGPPKGTAFGIAAVTQALKGLDFPITKRALLAHVKNSTIEYRKGQPVNLRQIIVDTDADEFASMANVVEAVSDAIEREGLSTREKEKV